MLVPIHHGWRRSLTSLAQIGRRAILAKAPGDLQDLLLDVGFPAESAQRVLEKLPLASRHGATRDADRVKAAQDAANAASDFSRVLQLLRSWNVQREALRAAIARHPELLEVKVEDIQATAQALQASLPRDVFGDLLKKFPEVLMVDGSAVMELQELFSSWGLPFEEAARRAPRLLLRVPEELSKLLHFLREDPLGPQLSGEQMAYAVKNYPMLLLGTLDAKKQLAPLVQFLRHFLGVDPGSPECLGFYAWPDALAVVEPTARFLVEDCGYSLEELREDVRLLGYSFEARVLPRGRYVQHLGVARLPLKALTAIDDNQFCHMVGSRKEEYLAFMFDLRRASRRKGGAETAAVRLCHAPFWADWTCNPLMSPLSALRWL
ncbi:unnamed protein product [Symbiodinium natans]|uniref:mTERF domain-containing protein 1, mitochondrial n=1 Tax=Symbiodinium natans TaxID=878477 RepID=A0A812V795_9DINO|nr:unnamed protein product [Symbiodinium natans]